MTSKGTATRREIARLLPMSKTGMENFANLQSKLPILLDQLRSMAPLAGVLPVAAGVYLFSEDETPMYVGQTRNLRRRISQHGGPTSRHNQAVFAFNLAKKDPDLAGRLPDVTRAALELDEAFAEVFRRHRERVAAMEIRFVLIDDPQLRTVFEVYAAMALNTLEYNSFDTH